MLQRTIASQRVEEEKMTVECPSPNKTFIINTTATLKNQGHYRRRGQRAIMEENCKSHRTERPMEKQCLLDMTEMLHHVAPVNS